MKRPEKTNGSRALDRVLFLAQPASDEAVKNVDVIHGNQDELSTLTAEFERIYRAGYEAGYASGKEAGFRQGYEAGFGSGRRQGDAGSTAAAAAVENTPRNHTGTGKARLFGLPCTKCGRWFFSDEASCPSCHTPRVTSAAPASATCGR